MTNRLGCSTIPFGAFDLEAALQAIAKIGFPVVDIAFIEGVAEHYNPLDKSLADFQELGKLVRSHGLTVSTLNVNAGSFNDSVTADKHTATVKSALDCASALRCCGVTTKVGDSPSGDWEESARLSVGRIRELADHANTLKVKLGLEIPHTKTLTDDLDKSVRFFEMVDHISVDVCFDSAHLYSCIGDFSEPTRLFVGKLGHCHLRDAKGDETHLIPGDGEIDFDFCHSMMRLAGFHRDYTLEIKMPETASLDEVKEALARGRDTLLPFIRPVVERKKKEQKEAG